MTDDGGRRTERLIRPLPSVVRSSPLPGEGDLVEHLGAEALGGAGDGAAAELAVELDRELGGRAVARSSERFGTKVLDKVAFAWQG